MTSHAAQFDNNESTAISPARTGAITVALILHISAFALLMAPMRRADRDVTDTPAAIELLMPEKVREIPPPPIVPVTPPRPPQTLTQTPRPPTTTTPIASEPVLPDAIAPEFEPVQITEMPTGIADTGEPFVPEQIGAVSYLSAPPPRYPANLLRRRVQGDVLLLVTIAADGSPESVLLHQSSGYAQFDKVAIEQVQRRWRFRPALVDGRATRSRAVVPISFRMAHK